MSRTLQEADAGGTARWQLPDDWQAAIANPPEDALLDYALLAAEVFFGEHVLLYGLDRARELLPEVLDAIARARVDPSVQVAQILESAGWTDERLGRGRNWTKEQQP